MDYERPAETADDRGGQGLGQFSAALTVPCWALARTITPASKMAKPIETAVALARSHFAWNTDPATQVNAPADRPRSAMDG